MSSTHQHISPSIAARAEGGTRRSFGTIWRPSMMQLVVDLLAFTVSFAVYQIARYIMLTDVRTFSLADHAVIASLSCAFWCLAFWMGGLYRDYYIRSPFEEFFALFRVTFLGSVTIFLLIFFGSSEDFRNNPRFVFFVYWLVLFGLTAIGRIIARQLQRRLREHGVIAISTVLIGTRERLAELLVDLQDEPA
jgi:FlaA1/EpsC-like NDP-sugar epimerase